ncbi:MAG: hypothetical protein QXM27_00475 [Candidatus Pacearchaeota archaeon]
MVCKVILFLSYFLLHDKDKKIIKAKIGGIVRGWKILKNLFQKICFFQIFL